MGAPGLGCRLGGRPSDGHGLLMMFVEAAGLPGQPLRFHSTRHCVRLSRHGSSLGGVQAPPGDTERVPAQTCAVADGHRGDGDGRRQQQPGGRVQAAKQCEAPHGNTFRSSSKCGPSRSVGQSPPQTMAVPWRAAAALNAAAMRG